MTIERNDRPSAIGGDASAVRSIAARASRAIGVHCEVMTSSDEGTVPAPEPADDNALGPTRDERGVDITLIDELLRLEPVERMRLNDRAVNAVLELRDAFAAKS